MTERYRHVAGKSRHAWGWKPDRPGKTKRIMMAPAVYSLPDMASCEWLMPPVNDQGRIGSCTANAVCEAIEAVEHRGQAAQTYSRLFLYYWARRLEGTPPTEDSGSQIGDAVQVASDRGVCTEAIWPYDDVERWQEAPSLRAEADAAEHKTLFAFDVPNLWATKASISNGWPVAFGFYVPANMDSADAACSGIIGYVPGEPYVGSHAVVAIGYDNTTGYVKFRNSWGDWGDGGNGYLPMEFWTAGLAGSGVSIRRALV